MLTAAGCTEADKPEQSCACVYAGYYEGMGRPPDWYSPVSAYSPRHLLIEILGESGERLGWNDSGYSYHDEDADFYFIGYDINVIYHHPLFMSVPSDIFIPDFLADEIAQNDKWFIEISSLANIYSDTGAKNYFGLKRSLYTGDYSYPYPPMLPVIDDKIIFTEQFESLMSGWFDPDIDNDTLIPVNFSAFSQLRYLPLCSRLAPPPPMLGNIILYNQQVLWGDWRLTLGTCNLHRREYHVEIDDKLFYNGMTVDELKEYFDSLTRANNEIESILPAIEAHLKMLYSLIK